MLFGSIDFPDKLIRAQAEGNLVVFAGAGVSMPAPSSLPSFRKLANQIGKGSSLVREDQEPDDRYLGRLARTVKELYQDEIEIFVRDRQSAEIQFSKWASKRWYGKTGARVSAMIEARVGVGNSEQPQNEEEEKEHPKDP